MPLGEGATLHDGAWLPSALPRFAGRVLVSVFLDGTNRPVEHEIANGQVTRIGYGSERYLVVCEGGNG